MLPARVLVIGIDAANPDLLQHWAEVGILPHLRALRTRGILGRTRGLEGFFVGSTWPSFYTGVTPARHGFHYLTQLKPGTYDFYRPATDGIALDPFWSHLSRAGRRVAVLDVPLTRLDSSLNGIQIVEWSGHDAVYGFRAWPPHVAETIRAHFGAPSAERSCDAVRRTSDDYLAFIDNLVMRVRSKANLTRHVLRQGGWDLFIQVFTESHCVGHQCWHLHDVTHPAHDPGIVAITGDPLRRVYAAIDAAIGDVIAEAGDALVVVIVAHGMSHWYGAQFLLPRILFQLSVAHPAPAGSPRPHAVPLPLAAARWGWRRLPAALRGHLAPLRQRFSRRAGSAGRLPTIGVHPGSSRCFAHPNGLAVGGIRLNVMGREPEGVLVPGAATETFASGLAADLLSIVDERTGKPLVRRVLRTADLYSGDRLDHLPDLLVEWSDDVPTGSTLVASGAGATVRAASPQLGVIEGANAYCRTGDHRPDGLFIVAGPTVRPAVLNREVSILDFAPTFTKLLGVDLPTHDGRPVEELFGSGPART